VPRVPLPNVGITFTGEKFNPSPARTLLPDYRYYELIRRSRQLFFLRLQPRSEVFAGCYQPLLPSGSSRRYLYESFLRCFIPCPGCPSKCICLFLPSSHRPSPNEQWVGFQLLPMYTTSHGERFRGCRYFIMLRPLSLLASQVVPTATILSVGQPRLLHPGRTYIVTFVCTGYANRPNSGN
jgi:hypothetical protein